MIAFILILVLAFAINIYIERNIKNFSFVGRSILIWLGVSSVPILGLLFAYLDIKIIILPSGAVLSNDEIRSYALPVVGLLLLIVLSFQLVYKFVIMVKNRKG